MQKIIKLLVLVFIVYTSMSTVSAEAPVRTLDQYTPRELVAYYAKEYNVNHQVMYSTMNCESSFNVKAKGDGGNSLGLSQINIPSHPNITEEQAYDKVFATKFMAEEFSKGNARKWTAYRAIMNGGTYSFVSKKTGEKYTVKCDLVSINS